MNIISNPINALLKHFTITLLMTTIGLMIGSQLPYSFINMLSIGLTVLLIVSFILVLISKRPSNGTRRRGFAMSVTYFYGLFFGIIITPTIDYYVSSLGADIVIMVFIITLIIVGALFAYSYFLGNDKLLKLGPVLFIITFILFITYFVLAFFTTFETTPIIITLISTLVFNLWIVYDVYRFKKYAKYITTKNDLAPYVLDLYLDFINLFLDLLRIFGYLNDDN